MNGLICSKYSPGFDFIPSGNFPSRICLCPGHWPHFVFNFKLLGICYSYLHIPPCPSFSLHFAGNIRNLFHVISPLHEIQRAALHQVADTLTGSVLTFKTIVAFVYTLEIMKKLSLGLYEKVLVSLSTYIVTGYSARFLNVLRLNESRKSETV